MSPSSDIETLFGHFGGNAGDYQEIGRENEASTARTRWPLLVTLDLTQPSIPAIVQRREPVSKQGDDAGQAQAVEDGNRGAAVAAGEPLTGTALLRSKAPLFARPHRRNIPAVANVVKADAPRGAERFSALPQVAAAKATANQAPVAAPITRAAVPAPAAPPVQPGSILGQMFKPATPSPAPAIATPAPQSAAAPLASLFDRLRGEAPAAATPAPHSWLTNGPRRS